MNTGKLAFAGVAILVVAAVIAGLIVSGSPQEQRLLRFDERRVADLQRVSRTVLTYYRETHMLPADLDTLVNGWASAGLPRDPQTDLSYDFEVLGNRSYRLCADFALDSRETPRVEFWSHAGGYQCFSFDYSEVVFD
jgi:hypothetical protein